MTEHRIQKVGGLYIVQALVEVGFRSFLRNFLQMKFLKPKYDWLTYRRDYETSPFFPLYRPNASGPVLEFPTFETASEKVEEIRQQEEKEELHRRLP